MENLKKDIWYIECSTGCSCCSDENFSQGFYDSLESANNVVVKYLNGDGYPLASQYARYGRYHIVKTEVEILPDGRMIVQDRVFPANHYGDHQLGFYA